jgi:copper chaperone
LEAHIEDNLLHASHIYIKGLYMLSLKVSGMTCGGCINAVTRAIQAEDPQATVQADLESQIVTLETTLTPAQASQLITDAGFPVSNPV